MNNATVVDEKVLNEITRALLQSDAQFNLVRNLQTNIKKIVNFDDLAAGHNKRKIIQQAVFDELCRMLDPGKPLVTPKNGEPIVVMFVGLQGSGKTTSCTIYAHYIRTEVGSLPWFVLIHSEQAHLISKMEMNEPCKAFAKNMSKIKGTLKRSALSRNKNARGMNAQMLNQIGGMSGLKSLMKLGTF